MIYLIFYELYKYKIYIYTIIKMYIDENYSITII